MLSAAQALWPRPSAPLVLVTPSPSPPAASPSPAPLVVVHVVGAVREPGVYRLAPGSRALDAVATAGGLTEEADQASLNLAAVVTDGQQIVVRPRPAAPLSVTAEEPLATPESAVGLAAPSRLNLNTASASELDSLPGIGPAYAQRILDRRQRLGPFQAIEQLRDEKLVPAATFERIKDLVTVN